MKLTRLLLYLFVVILALPLTVNSQSINSENLRDVNIDEISDSELEAYYQKAVNAGLTEQQVYKMALDRGLPDQELTKLKSRIVAIKENQVNPEKKDTSSKTNLNSQKTSDRKVNDDAMKVPMKKLFRDTTVFGSELFSEASMVFEPNLRIPSPSSYILGPDDQLSVNIYGYSEQTYSLTVDAEGNVYIPNVGPIKVNGLSIEEAGNRIRNKLASTIYKAIKTGKTSVEISLAKIRSIRVTVIGQATKPGTYTVSSLTTLFNILYLCGGPNETGSFRKIELIRGNKVVRKVDLYNFLMMGDRKDNLMLQEQDVVRIPYYINRVLLEGAVKRGGKYELDSTENFQNLLNYSGGFADSAYRSAVQVTRITDSGITLSDVAARDFSFFKPKSGDSYRVSYGLRKYTNRVSIIGAVFRPGDFELKSGMTLKDLVEIAGGLRQDAFLDRGLILRQNADLTLSSKSFEVKKVVMGTENVNLQKEDKVTISSILDMKDPSTVDIDGAIRRGGTFAYTKGLTVKDLVLKGGGFSENANISGIEISRRIQHPDIKQGNFKQTEIIQVDLSQGLSSAGGETILQPFDIVNVRTEAGYNIPRVVYVEGQVMNTGRYVLESSNERISNVIKRAGGFKGSADSSSIAIRRFINPSLTQQERQSIIERMLNISPDSIATNSKLRETFLRNVELMGVDAEKMRQNPGGNEDLILESGDLVTVASASNLVRVNGEVFHPTLLPFRENQSAKYYIKQSGNYTNNARKSQVFVIYPDGKAASVNRFLFFKSYPTVTPRSEVFVPSKDKNNRKGFGPGEWIAISSIIASMATMVVALVNAN